MSSSRRGSFVIHKGWEAQDNDQLTVRVGDVVMMEKSKRCGWSTLVNGQHWVIGVVDGKEGKFPLSHLTYRSLPESPNQVIGLAVATCDNYSAIKMIGGYIRYGKNEVIRITKKSHSDSEPWEGVSLWNNHGKIPAANLVEVPPSIPHPLEARFRKQLDEAGVFDRVTQLPKGLSLAPNVLAFLKSEDACTIIAGSVWKGLFVTLVALAHSKLTTYEPEEQQSSPSLADILDLITLVRMQTSDISAPSVQQVAHLLPLIADKESPLRHYAAMLFSQLEPWASDATRELALQHLEMLYEYSRSRHFIFRRFTARRIKLPDTEHKFGVFLTAGTLAVKYDRRIETWDQSHIELTLLSFLSHPNIVTAFGGTTLGSTRIIVMERMEMHLDTMIQEHFRTATDRESKQLKFNLYRQMLRGLIYLHSFNICHRDIKPSNIMVNRPTVSEGWRLKLIDVGVSRVAAPDITCTEKGIQSAHYPAPELRCSSSEAEDPEGIAVFRTEGRLKGDVYSLGWVISELWFEQRKARPQTGDNLPNALRLLIEECLSLDWWTRPTAEQAFQKVLQAEDIHTHM